MDEIFEILDETGSPRGLASRDEAHRQGLWHRATNVFVFYPDGRLLIQRRQLNKTICAGKWDLSVAEHLQPGEDYEQAARRGLAEELGITVEAMHALGEVVKVRLLDSSIAVKDYEFQQSFLTHFDGNGLAVDDREVMEIRAIDCPQLSREMAENPSDFTPWFVRCVRQLDILTNWNRVNRT